ncbi:uncharacterized protein P174DRAFT_50328 [Aspergillus novofumigatus IBT 16806]|uniref:Uncharacterized protein n=1 Tax=Aspergillus novofumigatus (strain IBT 16806) TaxID=1392255 RepID=A0A2I1CPI4_ASPN1|nr:uncharacterized protein P174DRAFT_50328 [Aspergillus novofumigatus IBT 16806]PKX99529.1 hypothetical protein P174DRAFT_50328 [Aspergillus novofumigatus IBT 16806]
MKRLCGMFDKDGCRRLDIRNHVTAIFPESGNSDSGQHLRRSVPGRRTYDQSVKTSSTTVSAPQIFWTPSAMLPWADLRLARKL